MKIKTQKSNTVFVIGLFLAFLLISGCAESSPGDISTSVDTPSATAFRPVGTIQGKVRDAVTLEPIVGALVSIGLATAVTDAQGQYILTNVPATTDALNNTVTGQKYDMTIDLRQVTSPVNMTVTSATTARYPNFSYADVEVKYTSLNDTTCDGLTGTSTNCESATNHDTPVEGLVTNADVNVGKLSATIKGVVAGCSGTKDFLVPVNAGFTVNLINAASGSENSGSGASGRVVATATTDANGAFSFNNIEANRTFSIKAMDNTTAPTMEGSASSVISPSDGQTKFLRVEESTAVHVCSVDIHGPEIVAVSPEPGSDLAAGTSTVVFTFNEAVKPSLQNATDASPVDNLFDHIEVNFDGSKAGNIPYTLAWNSTTTPTQLTVAFTTGASGKYHVRIKDLDTGGRFKDANGQNATMGVCPDDSNIPTTFGVTADAGTTDCSVWFTTTGGPIPGKPTLTLVNASSLDFSSTTGIFDWPVTTGAKTYNLYCQRLQVYQDSSSQTDSDFIRVGSALSSSAATFNFATFISGAGGFVGTGNEHALKYDCRVRGVNSDGVEGLDSEVVRAEDKVGPDFTLLSAAAGSPTVVLQFNEPVREADAETTGNYALTGTDAGLTLISAVYDTTLFRVTLTYGGNIAAAAGGDTLTVTNVKDVTGTVNLTTPAGTNGVTLP